MGTFAVAIGPNDQEDLNVVYERRLCYDPSRADEKRRAKAEGAKQVPASRRKMRLQRNAATVGIRNENEPLASARDA
eukprot:3438572-Pleurochrysis_carterae.AAC.1